ncbi:lytic transglycosylase domain-containing protein [Alkaliphilus hydrothermalis]|uniref:Soluble lytic murein transglycosylase n=1 Tax=Alkaliphilus hydrothermalis TaxID=1482730 RepID=A0ABS2NPJ6_9FIRM|nr:lytic transglycosylase domain-containing protein [Alkaliphilus hydrothermalis]MBM7614824.1 soluble lytic murein transglycosylase [Alkaliphilus hydrothermalis]
MIIVLSRKVRNILLMIILVAIMAIVMVNAKYILTTIYPFHYRDMVEKYAEKYDVDPYLVAAIIRNESRFNPRAISHREARGLMQIAPVTGDWAAEMLKIKNFTYEDLYEPELNIRIGIWYITVLDKEFKSNLQFMVAAYNAGNGNVTKWIKNPEYSSTGDYLDVIPFPETRNYVRKVFRDYERYQMIYGEQNSLQLIKHLVQEPTIF